MGRGSILKEANEKGETDDEGDRENEDTERVRSTLRLPPDVAEMLDNFADERGMSRNTAVIHCVLETLDS